jgi:hypothetical protein
MKEKKGKTFWRLIFLLVWKIYASFIVFSHHSFFLGQQAGQVIGPEPVCLPLFPSLEPSKQATSTLIVKKIGLTVALQPTLSSRPHHRCTTTRAISSFQTRAAFNKGTIIHLFIYSNSSIHHVRRRK